MKKQIQLNLDYIAGFFDGEGCVNISYPKGIRVIITNTKKEILEAINDYFGNIGKITSKMRVAKDFSIKKCFQLIFWNRRAEKVLLIIKEYLILKKEEALVAIEYSQTMLPVKGTKGVNGMLRVDEKIIKKRKELALICKNLK